MTPDERRGTVADFDAARGLGTIEDVGGHTWPFHCTQIADGSRQITIGAAVAFALIPGRLGHYEAAEIRAR